MNAESCLPSLAFIKIPRMNDAYSFCSYGTALCTNVDFFKCLCYLDEPKENKQLSLLDLEENAVEGAYEPPSKVEKPLAFSQATIDEFIRLGGCTKGSTERIYGYYRRANDTAENVLFLRHEYETDHVGIIIDGRKIRR